MNVLKLLILAVTFSSSMLFAQVVNPTTGGGVPTGACGGDLGGTYPNCTVVGSHIVTGTLNTVSQNLTSSAVEIGLQSGNTAGAAGITLVANSTALGATPTSSSGAGGVWHCGPGIGGATITSWSCTTDAFPTIPLFTLSSIGQATFFNKLVTPHVVAVLESLDTQGSGATPGFSTLTRASMTTLTINAVFSLAAGAEGQEKTLTFCQDGTGSWTVTPPANVHGFFSGNSGNVGSTASKCNSQHFTYYSAQTAWLADSPGVINQ